MLGHSDLRWFRPRDTSVSAVRHGRRLGTSASARAQTHPSILTISLGKGILKENPKTGMERLPLTLGSPRCCPPASVSPPAGPECRNPSNGVPTAGVSGSREGRLPRVTFAGERAPPRRRGGAPVPGQPLGSSARAVRATRLYRARVCIPRPGDSRAGRATAGEPAAPALCRRRTEGGAAAQPACRAHSRHAGLLGTAPSACRCRSYIASPRWRACPRH